MQDPDQLIFIFNYLLMLLLLMKDSHVITKLLGKLHFGVGK